MGCRCMLTTFDNPYNPFEDFTLWWLYDIEKGYNTCGYLDRVANFSDDMSSEEEAIENERAIDQIIENDFLNIYKKVWCDGTGAEESSTETIKA